MQIIACLYRGNADTEIVQYIKSMKRHLDMCNGALRAKMEHISFKKSESVCADALRLIIAGRSKTLRVKNKGSIVKANMKRYRSP